MNIWIVIAAYNEEKRITKVVQDLKHYKYKNIVIVDDCSKDNTYAVALKTKVTVLKHVINLGQGAALKTGITYALEHNADIIVTFDGDGQHLASEISRLISPLNKGYEITTGSRFLDKRTKMPLARKIILKGSVLILRMFYGLKVTDAHNGFRALSKKAAQKIEIKCDRMAHASEIISEIKKKNLKFKEVPVKIIYNEEVLNKGHGGIIQAFKVFFSMIIHKLR